MSAARSAAERVREFVRGGGTGDAGLDHDLMLLAGEVLAPSTVEARALPAIIRDNVEKGRREWWDGYRWFGLGSGPLSCAHTDSWFDRSICPEPCGSMHERCSHCGKALGHCRLEDGAAS